MIFPENHGKPGRKNIKGIVNEQIPDLQTPNPEIFL